ncbi:transposase family protein [Streptomyces sp. NPDC006668]|uniref:transposase family protein n=1 Tax=Streptomyces sp. NPDC006668 TaxID=3156903 RepID=UPI0033FAD1C1
MVTGYKATRARKLTSGQKQANRILAAGRAPVEQGFAHLKAWRILTRLRTDPARATALLRALLVMTISKSADDGRSTPQTLARHQYEHGQGLPRQPR